VSRERILFVCTGNIDRSRTAEDLYLTDPRYEVRSAGTASFAETPVSRELLNWADRIFVMNERDDGHASQIRMRFPEVKAPLIDLDVQDRWRRSHPDLVALLMRRLAPHLGAPQTAGQNAQ
jgi:predicted protein tyrosine phosphatase